MNGIELENCAQSVVARIRAGVKFEDARLELKREWTTPPARTARQLAAHCNASASDCVVWIIGLGEDGSWRQDEELEAKQWMHRLLPYLDQGMPSLMLDRKVFVGDNHVTALLIDATRRPYVWNVTQKEKDKQNNEEKGPHGAVHREVPWRVGAAAESARREHLIRLLAPMASKPMVEVVGGSMFFFKPGEHLQNLGMDGEIELYFVPFGSAPTILPFHKMAVRLTSPHDDAWAWEGVVNPLLVPSDLDQDDLVRTSKSGFIINGPGSAKLKFGAMGLYVIPEHILTVNATLSYMLAGQSTAHECVAQFTQLGPDIGTKRWSGMPNGLAQ